MLSKLGGAFVQQPGHGKANLIGVLLSIQCNAFVKLCFFLVACVPDILQVLVHGLKRHYYNIAISPSFIRCSTFVLHFSVLIACVPDILQALIHGLNRHYYSIAISYRKNELEERMLMNLQKKAWTHGLNLK